MPVVLTWPVIQPAPTPVVTPVIPIPTQISNAGNNNLNEEEILRKFLHPGIKGPNTDALLAGLAAGDKIRNQIAETAYDQGFIISASGEYLERRAARIGIKKPQDLGLSDIDFRNLAITLDNNKLTYEAILENLEIYYGILSVKASMECLSDSPYALQNGDELDVLFNDKEQIRIIFDTKAFADITQATAVEVCTFINDELLNLGFESRALPTIDPISGNERIVLVSGKRGLSSSVQVNGGRAQTVFNFPTPLFIDNGSSPYAAWTITLSSTPGNLIFTTVNSLNFDFNQLIDGDLVYIYGNEFVASNNIGAFPISNVQVFYNGLNLVQSFEITNPLGTATVLNQTNYNSLRFFKFTKNTLYSQLRKVVVAKHNGELNIIIPATTQIVGRTPESGAYLQSLETFNISSLNTINGTGTIITTTDNGLSQGDFFQIDDAYSTDVAPSITAGTPSGNYSGNIATGITNGSIQTSVSDSTTVNKIRHKALSLPNNILMALSGEIQQDVGGTPTVADPKATVLLVTSKSILSDGSIQENYSWKQQTNTLTVGTYDFGAIVLKDGRTLATGGFNGDNQISSPFAPLNNYDLLTYDTGSNTLTQESGTLPSTLAGHATANLNDGNAIICGGWTSQATWNNPGSQAYKFNSSTNLWSSIASMSISRMNHEAILLNTNKVLVIGGRDPFRQVGAAEDPNDISYWPLDSAPGNNTTDIIAGNTISISAGVDAVSGKGRGGQSFLPGSPTNAHTTAGAPQTALNTDLLSTWTAECWVLADATGAFMSNGQAGGGSANNCLLSFGISKSSPPDVTNDGKFFWRWENGTHAEVINYSTILANTIFKTYESSHQGIWHHVALTKAVAASGLSGKYDVSLYVDGNLIQVWTDQVNATGGSTGLFYLAQDPTRSTMTQLNTRVDEVRLSSVARPASEIKAHYNRQSGYILFDDMNYWASEYKIGPCLNSCELYDSGGNSWSNTGPMAYSKTAFGVVSLPDGRIMTIGGLGYDPTQSSIAVPLNIVEIYDPGSGRWSMGPKMPTAREFPTCVLLNNKIWVMGGRSDKTIDILDLNTFQWKTSLTSQSVAPYRSVGGLVDNNTLAVCGGAISTPAIHLYGATHNADLTSRLGSVIIPGTEEIRGGSLDGVFQVTNIISTTKFQYQASNSNYANLLSINATITKLAAASAPLNRPGPYIFDTKTGFAVTATQTTLSTALDADQPANLITVGSTAGLAANDYLLFNFGFTNQVGPIKIISVISSTQLLIDPGFIITADLPVGSNVMLLSQRTPFQPPDTDTLGSFWVCPSPAGRIAAENQLESVVAAGFDIVDVVQFPKDTGLGNQGQPDSGQNKISDIVWIFGSDNPDDDLNKARSGG